VSLRTSVRPALAVKTSAIVDASEPRNATRVPSWLKEKPDRTDSLVAPRCSTVLVAGSRRYKPEYVLCDAEKNSPVRFQSTIDGSSSKEAVSAVGAPPPAGMVAMTRLA